MRFDGFDYSDISRNIGSPFEIPVGLAAGAA